MIHRLLLFFGLLLSGADELHAFADDLSHRPIEALVVLVLAGAEPPFEEGARALLEVLLSKFGGASVNRDGMPLRFGRGFAVAVLVAAGRCHADDAVGVAVALPDVGVGPEVAEDDDFVE